MTTPSENTIFASLASGMLSTFVGHPFDLTRTRLLYGNQLGTLSSLSRGLPFTVTLSIVRSGSAWPLQQKAHSLFHNTPMSEFQRQCLSGATANVLPNFIFAPLNTLKVHLIRDHEKRTYSSIIKNIHATLGLRGFYAGLTFAIIRDFAWGGLYFSTRYEFEKKVKEPIAIFGAALLATTLTSWIDAVRLHLMNADRADKPLLQIMKSAMALTENNIKATALGVARVSISTTVGHLSYLTMTSGLK